MATKTMSKDDAEETYEARFIRAQIAMMNNEWRYIETARSRCFFSTTPTLSLERYLTPFHHIVSKAAYYCERVPASLLIDYLQAIERFEAAIDLKARPSLLS